MALEMTAAPAMAIFFSGMLHASLTDIKHRRIYNWTVLALVAAWVPTALIAGLPNVAMLGSVSAAIVVFALGFLCFLKGWLGGGDVKLAAVAALWLGHAMVPAFLLLSALFGAVITLIFIAIAYLKRRQGTDMRAEIGLLPYGPGLASAAVVLFGNSQWFTHL